MLPHDCVPTKRNRLRIHACLILRIITHTPRRVIPYSSEAVTEGIDYVYYIVTRLFQIAYNIHIVYAAWYS